MSYENWKQMWRIGHYSERLGQAFCNEFMIGVDTGKMYYAEDYWEADKLITEWLINNCHYPDVPMKVY